MSLERWPGLPALRVVQDHALCQADALSVQGLPAALLCAHRDRDGREQIAASQVAHGLLLHARVSQRRVEPPAREDDRCPERTAWFLLHRIRASMVSSKRFLSGTVEVDETYVVGKRETSTVRRSCMNAGMKARRLSLAPVNEAVTSNPL